MCRRPLHFTVQNSWVTVSIDNISNKNNKEYVLLLTVKVARVTVIVIVILLCTVSHTQWQSCEWCCWFTNATPHWAYEQVGINTWRCFLQIALKSSNVFSMWSNHWGSFSVVYFFFGSINERLLKMENQNNIQARWLPSDVQYQSSLITSEAVKAKQTLDMMLVSGRRRWFLLSLKKKYAGTFSLLVWKYEISLINSIGTLEANTSLKKKTFISHLQLTNLQSLQPFCTPLL